jgi:hypothetical protein
VRREHEPGPTAHEVEDPSLSIHRDRDVGDQVVVGHDVKDPAV